MTFQAAKTFKKSVDDSLRTAPGKYKNEAIDVRKKRLAEFLAGDHVHQNAVAALKEEKPLPHDVNTHCPQGTSPLTTIMERFANMEKHVAHMLADSEQQIAGFMTGPTPLFKLLNEELPAAMAAKKDLEALCRKQAAAQSNLEKEQKKLDKLINEEDVDPEKIKSQTEARDNGTVIVENLAKEVVVYTDRLSSTLLVLVSRENRYAQTVLQLMRYKKRFYEDAFKTIEAELPHIERVLDETQYRPVFGEPLEDHLVTGHRQIAFPLALTVRCVLDSGFKEEGLFRISPKQIKLDKMKAYIDAHQPLGYILADDNDVHLHAGLMKCYLRELPDPLLATSGPEIYDMWLSANVIRDEAKRVREISRIIHEGMTPSVALNVQFVMSFLVELAKHSDKTKMDPHNIAIVFGPTLLFSTQGVETDTTNLEPILKLIMFMIKHHDEIYRHPMDLRALATTESNENVNSNPAIDPQNPSQQAPPSSTSPGIYPSLSGATSARSSQPSSPKPAAANPHSQSKSPSPSGSSTHLSAPPNSSGLSSANNNLPVPAPRSSLAAGVDFASISSAASPNHKRKHSIRSMGKNFFNKVGGSSSGSTVITHPTAPPPSRPPQPSVQVQLQPPASKTLVTPLPVGAGTATSAPPGNNTPSLTSSSGTSSPGSSLQRSEPPPSIPPRQSGRESGGLVGGASATPATRPVSALPYSLHPPSSTASGSGLPSGGGTPPTASKRSSYAPPPPLKPRPPSDSSSQGSPETGGVRSQLERSSLHSSHSGGFSSRSAPLAREEEKL